MESCELIARTVMLSTGLGLILGLAGIVSPVNGNAADMGQSQNKAAGENPEYHVALGSAMEDYPYPFEVQYLPLTIEGQDVRMAYMDVAPETGQASATVVLLHGKNFYGSYFENTARMLSKAGYRVVIPDQVGFGKSSKPDIHYSFDLVATNTVTLLDKLGVQKFDVVGHSMGGMVAARVALNFPERVTNLVFENPIGLEDYRFKVPPLSTEHVYQNELATTDPAKIRAFLKRYVVDWKPDVFERFVEVRSRVALGGEYPRWAMAAALTYQMIYQQPVVHEFPNIKARTLVVIGQEDRTTLGRGFVAPEVLATLGNYPELGKATARAIPDARLVPLAGVGHIPHLEIPEKYHAILLDFLNGKTVGEPVK